MLSLSAHTAFLRQMTVHGLPFSSGRTQLNAGGAGGFCLARSCEAILLISDSISLRK